MSTFADQLAHQRTAEDQALGALCHELEGRGFDRETAETEALKHRHRLRYTESGTPVLPSHANEQRGDAAILALAEQIAASTATRWKAAPRDKIKPVTNGGLL